MLGWVKAAIHVEPDGAAVAVRALQLVVETLAVDRPTGDPLSIVLSGGSTPRPLYRLMAQEPARSRIPWSRLHVFWADERAVPPTDEQSNYRLAAELLLEHVPIPPQNIHRMQGELEPQQAAQAYQKLLASLAAAGNRWLQPDIVILGLGEDGHVASLFPGSPALAESERAVLAVQATYQDRPAGRITLTPAVLNGAHRILFLVTGKAKRPAVRRALNGPLDPLHVPAHALQPRHGEVIWLLDKAAAG